jgi:imidazolonepropionase-like amidohydrolase
MNKTKTTLLASVFTIGALFSAQALATQYAIVGAKVHTLSSQGTLDNASVLIKDGVIEAVVAGADVPSGYARINAQGKVVTPGLIGAYTSLGLQEVSMSAGQIDSSADESDFTTVGAAFDVSFAVNPDSTLIAINRMEGITAAATNIERSEYMFKGQGTIMQLADDDPVLAPRAFITLDMSGDAADDNGGSRAILWPKLLHVLAEAQNYDSEEYDGFASKADMEALSLLFTEQKPLLIMADRKADILQIIRLKNQYKGLNVVLVNGAEAWRVAEQLAQANIPVILNPEYNLPGNFERIGATLANAGRLANAGVTIAIGMETHNIRLATQHAGNAVANGLAYADGLAALTKNVAAIFGVDDQIGQIAPGMRADVVIWSGDPLEVTEAAEHVFIAGKPIAMRSRQTELRDRYLGLQDTKPMPHHRP